MWPGCLTLLYRILYMAKARVWTFMGTPHFLAFDGESEVYRVPVGMRRSSTTIPDLDREVRNYPKLYKVIEVELPDELYGKEIRDKYPITPAPQYMAHVV